MPDHRDNLLIALDRWASGQHENFLTEAFVDVLNRLSSSSPELFGQLLKRITDGEFNPAVEELAGFNVVSQLSTDQGSPDIAIMGPDHYALIEVKDQSPVDPDQLNRYSRLIELNTAGNKCLVLLTRDQAPPLDIKWLQKPIRWYQVLEWIGDIKDKHELDDVSGYVIRQFLGFLEGRGMAVEKVGWEFAPGLRQLMNLKTLMREALEGAGAHRVWTSYGSEFNGVAIPAPETNNSGYFFFVNFDRPGELVFSALTENVLPEHVDEWSRHLNNQMKKTLDIGSEEIHFHSRGLASQRVVLEQFAAECLAETIYAPAT